MQGDLPFETIDIYWHTAALPLLEGVAMDAVTVGQQGVTWGFGIAKTATQMGVSVEDSVGAKMWISDSSDLFPQKRSNKHIQNGKKQRLKEQNNSWCDPEIENSEIETFGGSTVEI